MRFLAYGSSILLSTALCGCFGGLGTANQGSGSAPAPATPGEPAGGGGGVGDTVTPGGSTSPRLAPCGDAARVEDAYTLFTEVDASVHELVTCGGLQRGISVRLAVIVLLSNPQLFEDQETYHELVSGADALGLRNMPFAPVGDGRWELLLPDAADSRFVLRFWDPAEDRVITENPFVMDSYLVGARITTLFNFEEMKSNWQLRNEYRVSYEALGPLGGALGITAPGPGTFTMTASLMDFFTVVASGTLSDDASFGALENLNTFRLDSEMSYHDVRDEVVVNYQALGTRATLKDTSQGVSFSVTGLDGAMGSLSLVGETSGIHFVPDGSLLAGQLSYTVAADLTPRWTARSDFGEGAKYPSTTWGCAP